MPGKKLRRFLIEIIFFYNMRKGIRIKDVPTAKEYIIRVVLITFFITIHALFLNGVASFVIMVLLGNFISNYLIKLLRKNSGIKDSPEGNKIIKTNPVYFPKKEFEEFIQQSNKKLSYNQKISASTAKIFRISHNGILFASIALVISIFAAIFLGKRIFLITGGFLLLLFSIFTLIQCYNAFKYNISATFTPSLKKPYLYLQIGEVKGYAWMYLFGGIFFLLISLVLIYSSIFVKF